MDAKPIADESLSRESFLVRDALRRGYGRGVFMHARWHRPYWGVRSAAPKADNLRDRALQYLPRLRPGERFSHDTALALFDCPIRVPQGASVDVSSPRRMGRVESVGVNGHCHASETPEYSCQLPDVEGWIPASDPLVAVLQVANELPFIELVVALDHLLRDDSKRFDPYFRIDPQSLARFAEAASGRGSVRFRAAAALARVGAESRMETLMRLGAESVGLTELQLQAELRADAGQWIGRFDATDFETRSIFEYDGDQHFTRAQRRRDAMKLQAARDAGWRVLVFYREDLSLGLRDVGCRMLDFSGRRPRKIPVALARLLAEVSGPNTESAIPVPRYGAREARV